MLVINTVMKNKGIYKIYDLWSSENEFSGVLAKAPFNTFGMGRNRICDPNLNQDLIYQFQKNNLKTITIICKRQVHIINWQLGVHFRVFLCICPGF